MCAACRLYRIFMFLINVRALCRCHCSFACQGHTLAAVSSIGPGTTTTQKARPSSEAQHTLQCCRLQCLLPARRVSLPWS